MCKNKRRDTHVHEYRNVRSRGVIRDLCLERLHFEVGVEQLFPGPNARPNNSSYDRKVIETYPR